MKKIAIITFLFFSLGCNQQKSYLESLSISDIDLHIKYQDSIFKVNNKYPNDLYSFYDKLINENSDSASVYYFRGRIDSIKSVTFDYYKKSLEKDSSFFHVLISLALFSLEGGLNNEGINFANKAKEKAPERQESYYVLQLSYANLHDKAKNVNEKLKYLKKAIDNSEFLYRLTNDQEVYNTIQKYYEILDQEQRIISYNTALNNYNSSIIDDAKRRFRIGMTNSVLNYRQSIKSEMELGAIIGMRVDFSLARSLAVSKRFDEAFWAIYNSGVVQDVKRAGIFGEQAFYETIGVTIDDMIIISKSN